MNREQVLSEIRRVAEESKQPPGKQAFARATGIREADWYPQLWLRWGDALVEAGYTPNILQTRTDDLIVIEKFACFARELGRLVPRKERF